MEMKPECSIHIRIDESNYQGPGGLLFGMFTRTFSRTNNVNSSPKTYPITRGKTFAGAFIKESSTDTEQTFNDGTHFYCEHN